MSYKPSLNEIEPGDVVVYTVNGYAGRTEGAFETVVTRVTKTQVTIKLPTAFKEAKFSKDTGMKLGDRGMYADRIYAGERAEIELKVGKERMLRRQISNELHKVYQLAEDDMDPITDIKEKIEAVLKLFNPS